MLGSLGNVRFLVIGVGLVIVGVVMYLGADQTARRAAMIQAEPTPITYEQLLQNGPPANRYVRLLGVVAAEEFAIESDEHDRWNFALVGLDSAAEFDANPNRAESPRLIAKVINVDSEAELSAVVHQDFIDGFIWDEHASLGEAGPFLTRSYPPLARCGAHRVLMVGQPTPTLAAANQERMIAMGLIAGGVMLVTFLVWLFVKRRRDVKNQVWHDAANQLDAMQAGQPAEAHASPTSPAADNSFAGSQYNDHPAFGTPNTPQDRPSDFGAMIKASFCYASGLSLAGLLIGIALNSTAMVPPAIVNTMMGGCGLVLMISSVGFVALNRRFRDQVYDVVSTSELPGYARRYFEEQTLRLRTHGFVSLGDLKVIDGISASVRLLLRNDGRCLVTMEAALLQTVYNFYSIAADGTLIYTSSCDLKRDPNSPLPCQYKHSNSKDIYQGYQLHNAQVEAWGYGNMATIAPEYATGVMDFAHRISGWSQKESGVIKTHLLNIPRAEELFPHVSSQFEWRSQPNELFIDEATRRQLASRESLGTTLESLLPAVTPSYEAPIEPNLPEPTSEVWQPMSLR